MEIRARISLEVAKFKANATLVAAQFKTMGTSAQRYQNNVDHYAKRSLDRTKNINAQRVQDASKTGQAILAREKQIADDRYSIIMQGAKRAERDRTKLELEAARNKGGIKSGTNVGRPLTVLNNSPESKKQEAAYQTWLRKAHQETLQANTRDAYAKLRGSLSAQKAEQERYQAWLKANTQGGLKARESAEKAASRQIAAAKKFELSAIKEIEKQNVAAARAIQRHYADVEKSAKRLADAAQREFKKLELIKYFKSDDFESKLASTRYALYDVGQRAIAFGTAVAAGFAAAVKAAIQFESAFTSVERTAQVALNPAAVGFENTNVKAKELKDALVALSTEIPVAFDEIARIATLGAQLGISVDNIEGFTETVAKFSAITKISVDEVGMSFGRLSQLMNVPAEKFENLSSAIAFTGVNSVATDQEILRMSESISAASTQAGIAAEDTIGFAAALASLKVAPEEARGVLTRLFRDFDVTVTQGGSRLDDLARVIGVTSQDAARLWEQDPSQFVQAFLGGAKATGKLNEALISMGITNTRETNVISKLANNMDVLQSSIADSRYQFEAGTFSSEAYGLVVDDVASKMIIMQNAITAMGAAFGETLLPFLSLVIDGITGFVKTITEAPPAVKILAMGITALTAGAAIFFGSLALGVAGLLALRLAFDNLRGSTVSAGLGLGTFRALLISMLPASGGATTALAALSNQARATTLSFGVLSINARVLMLSLGAIGIALTVAAVAVTAFAAAEEKAAKAGKVMIDAAGGADAINEALAKDEAAGAAGKIGELSLSLDGLTESQKEARAEQERLAQAAVDERVERTKANTATAEGKKAYEDALKAQAAFNEKLKEGNGELDTNTVLLGQNTKQLVINALAKYNEQGDSFWATLVQLDPATTAALEAAGFDAGKMIDAGLKKEGGAEEYFKNVLADIDVTKIAPDDLGLFISAEIETGKLYDGVVAVDSLTDGIKTSTAAADLQKEAMNGSGAAIEEAGEQAVDFNDILREQIGLLTSGQLSENKVASALNEFAAGAKATNGELDGMSEAADTNLSNFATFMEAAAEASINAGEGTEGAVRRIVGGLNALGAQGVNTADAFQKAKTLIVSSISETVGADQKLKDQLNATTNVEGIRQAIRAFYAVKIAAASSGEDVRNFTKGLNAALGVLDGTDYTITPKADTSKAKTALEKLQETLQKAFKSINVSADVQNSLNSLGKSLRDNGKGFSQFSEGGRSNIESLQSVIDSLAEKSGGNLKTFANDLASLRQALVAKGVSGQGLALIDLALKNIKTRGTAAKNSVVSFGNALGDLKQKKATLSEIAEAVSKISSEIKKAFDSNFAYSDSIDNITLGWEAMAESSKAAVAEIEALKQEALDLSDAIDEAKSSIDEANASIQTLAAERGKIEYQLQIAVKYGDTLRANDLTARLQEIDTESAAKRREIADANSEIADSQKRINSINTEVTTPDTATEIINRNKALRDMAARYGDMTSYMMINADEGADLNAIVNQQVTAFEKNAVAMGYTATQAAAVAAVLRDSLLTQVDAAKAARIDLGITIDTTTAATEVDGFVADANEALKGIKPYDLKANTKTAVDAVVSAVKSINLKLGEIKDKTVVVTTVNQSTGGSALGVIRRAQGGLVTGPGSASSDSIAARLSNGEYVIRAAAVKHYGTDFMNALNNTSLQQSPMSFTAPAAASSQTVFLSQEDRQLLRAAMDRPIALYTDNATIAKAANDGNTILAQRGTR